MSELKSYKMVDEDYCDNALCVVPSDVYLKSEADEVIRRLKRALWISRARVASKEVDYWTCQDESSYSIVDFNVRHETIVSYKEPHHRPYKWILIWENVELICLKKADEFKEDE
jgi:hypothetical protein